MVTEATGSITARGAAAARAIESQKSAGERILYDPYAAAFTDEEGYRFIRWLDELMPGIHLTHVGRAWAIDEHVKQEAAAGGQQVVILGAGFDSTAYRMDDLKERGIRVFEVDEPTTSRQKQAKVQEILGKLPEERVAYIPVDFEQETVEDMRRKMLEKGYELGARTVFTLGGVLPYLNEEAADTLFRFIARNAGPGSSIVFTDFDFVRLAELGTRDDRVKGFFTEVARVGEPIKFGLGPERVEGYLQERGYGKVAMTSVREVKQRFNKPTHEIDPLYFVVRAWL
ncbi:MAG: SAM-dependent methyltransferase [Candidatus Tectomicrobia bacterium]|uniref:S-adenosyl-L-methionine-dependent methyltransferase n=1 Tax=Tectimicrobiota bacterium TaxID=2528274 RepID=A0A932CQ15_UNCTE|nr:SAM-dependent methyltransferase [Candidatus Tectomicrobia bacterium]